MMSSVLSMIIHVGRALKVSIELLFATRRPCGMTERLLIKMLNQTRHTTCQFIDHIINSLPLVNIKVI